MKIFIIIESLLIGFNYKKNKLLNFRNIKTFSKITNKTIELLNDFLDLSTLINNFNCVTYPDFNIYKIIIIV